MIAQWHLLGSIRGYTTLAHSQGLRADERAALESLGFGQTDDAEFRSSLTTKPAAVGRPLPSGRYCLTRCLPGSADESGRSTLLFASLVLEPADWIDRISECAAAVLGDPKIWNQMLGGATTPIELRSGSWRPTEFSANIALAALDAWIAARSTPGTLVALADAPEHSAAILGLPRLLPAADRARLSWGVRLLSSSAPVAIASLCTAPDRRRTIVSPRFGQALSHPYPRAVASFWQSGGAIPTSFIQGVSNVDEPFQLIAAPQSDEAPRNKWVMPAVIGAMVVLGIAGGVWYAGRSPAPAPQPVPHESSNNTPAPPIEPPTAKSSPADAGRIASPAPPVKTAAPASAPTPVAVPTPAVDPARELADRWRRCAAWTTDDLAAFIRDAGSHLAAVDELQSVPPSTAPDIDPAKHVRMTDEVELTLAEQRDLALKAQAWIATARAEVATGIQPVVLADRARTPYSNTTLNPDARTRKEKLLNTYSSKICRSTVHQLCGELREILESADSIFWQGKYRPDDTLRILPAEEPEPQRGQPKTLRKSTDRDGSDPPSPVKPLTPGTTAPGTPGSGAPR